MRGVALDAVRRHGAQQDPWELEAVLTILRYQVRPAVILEIGSWAGGTLYAWAQTGAQVIAVTLPEHAAEPFTAHGAAVVWGDSTDPGVQATVASALPAGRADFVWVDGGHDAATAAADIAWACQLAPHGVVGVHDINLYRRHPSEQVRTAWDAARAGRPHIEIARDPDTTPGTGLLWPGG